MWTTGLGLVLAGVACGQKGPPLAPLHLLPAPVTELSVRRVADRAQLRFVLPTRNENGAGRLDLARVEIYAQTLGPAAPVPDPRDFATKDHLVGEVGVRPVLEEGETAAPDESRPEPGAPVSFDELLTEQKLQPAPAAPSTKPSGLPGRATDPGAGAGATPKQGAAGTQAPAAAAATKPDAAATTQPASAAAKKEGAAAEPTAPRRVYLVRGVSTRGRAGAFSSPVSLPLLPPPAPPQEVRSRFTETAVIIEWTAAAAAAYNVYAPAEPLRPLNPAPLQANSFERPNATFGQEQCYQVRSVLVVEAVTIEGEASAPRCVTPVDQFPPAAPRGLAAVPTAGQISLIWEASTEKDVAGYLVLRGPAPDGPLAAVTPAPIRENSFADTAVQSGTRYVYAVVAVDTASPANVSAQSARVEETAR